MKTLSLKVYPKEVLAAVRAGDNAGKGGPRMITWEKSVCRMGGKRFYSLQTIQGKVWIYYHANRKAWVIDGETEASPASKVNKNFISAQAAKTFFASRPDIFRPEKEAEE